MNKKLYQFIDEKINKFCSERIKNDKRLSMISKFIIAVLTEGENIKNETIESLFGKIATEYSLKELQELSLVTVKNGIISLQGRYNSNNEKYKLFKKAYSKLLKNEKWVNYKKDEKCLLCNSTDNLQLHHTFYIKDAFWKPWEYPKQSIVTLCDKCHMQVHFDKKHPLHEKVLLREEAKKIYKEFL